MLLFFDVETNGLAKSRTAPYNDLDNWPRVVQLAWILCDENGENRISKNFIVFPKDFSIPEKMSAIHGITIEKAEKEGVLINKILNEFNSDLQQTNQIIAHNIEFDLPILNAEFLRNKIKTSLLEKKKYCTMKSPEIIAYCKIPNNFGDGYKWPSLSVLHEKVFGATFKDSHNALADVEACFNCYFDLKRRGVI